MSADRKPKPLPTYMNFVLGGTAGAMAACVVHPMDVIKNGMQVAGMQGKTGTIGSIFKDIISNQGVPGLYKGIGATILRQLTYTTIRMGVYNGMLPMLNQPDGSPPSFGKKALLGMWAGTCGAFVGTPAEVCLIRMSADGRLPPADRRNYTNVGNALIRIVKEEGVLTLWRGVIPTVARAIVVNASQLATYSQAKEIFVERGMKEGLQLHFCASMTSGFITAFTSLPVDILKTRVQNMKVVDGKPQYSGAGDAFMKIISKEGPLTFWKGFIPYYCRLGPQTVLLFIFLENLTAVAKEAFNNS